MTETKTTDERDFYKKVYREENPPWSDLDELDRRTLKWIKLAREEGIPNSRVLDLGTGEGRIAQLFDDQGFFSIGIDYLLEPLMKAKPGSGKTSPQFLVANAFSPPFDESGFASIVDYGLLHHVRKTNWNHYRSILTDLLSEQGFFFVNVFHEEDSHSNRTTRNWVYHRGHYDRFFTMEGLRECIGPDFQCLKSEKFDQGEHTFLHVLYRYLP